MRVRSLFSLGRSLWVLGVLVLLSSCPACSSGRKPVHKVHGQVLVDGRPAAQAQVLLHPAEGGGEELRPAGQTDDQGHFQLTSYANGDGAPEGDYAVTVTWFRVYKTGGEAVPYNALPRRYAAAPSSALRVTIRKGDNDLSPFRLTSR